MQICSYRSRYRSEWAALWNRCFRHARLFQPMTRGRVQDRIERRGREGFSPRHLRVAIEDERLLGFVHGGYWGAPVAAGLYPEQVSDAGLGFLCMVAVDPEFRRRGIATALWRDLQHQIEGECGTPIPWVADGRMFNPFYGNVQAPRAPLWGTSEGIAIVDEESAVTRFMETLQFQVEARAESWELPVVTPDSQPSVDAALEWVNTRDYQPQLGGGDGWGFAEANHSETWIAARDGIQLGYLIAYPLLEPTLGSKVGEAAVGKQWGIYALEVDAAFRGRGLGRALLRRVLADLAQRGVESLETLVLPDESPAAARLYAEHGAVPRARWRIYR